jgi:hypothetical protein
MLRIFWDCKVLREISSAIWRAPHIHEYEEEGYNAYSLLFYDWEGSAA